jgi:uncharacterized protein YqjF (DUF2071 family)
VGRRGLGPTPFFIRVRPPGVPFVRPGWAFPETNVRTYVRTPERGAGIWFLRMEVSALWFVATLRAVGLPYFWQRMAVDAADGTISYTSRPGPAGGGGGHDIVVRPGTPLEPPTGGAFDRFVVARWGAYHRRGGQLLYTPSSIRRGCRRARALSARTSRRCSARQACGPRRGRRSRTTRPA